MKKFKVTVNGTLYDVVVEELEERRETPELAQTEAPSKPGPVTSTAPKTSASPVPAEKPKESKPAATTGGTVISAPMPGSVIEVKVNEGDRVNEGDVLLILEAMKMENEVTSSVSGTVKEIKVSKGQAVNTGDPMIVIE